VWTDTAAFADVVLPATTFLEHDDLSVGYGAGVVSRLRAAIDPIGDSRPNYAVFAELGRRLGFDGFDRTAEQIIDTVTASSAHAELLRRQLEESGVAQSDPIPFVDEFPRTHDRKVHLCPPELDIEAAPIGGLYAYQPDPKTAGYPLSMISPAVSRTDTSVMGELERAPATVTIHPHDAAERGIENAMAVRIFNDLGEVHCYARVSDDVRVGVVDLPKGLWSHRTINGATSTSLCPDTLSDLGGGATFNDARVQVTQLAGHDVSGPGPGYG
jgi:anaerobic selenocysteine-containing dehydrogenase